jgi:hypothetical protein
MARVISASGSGSHGCRASGGLTTDREVQNARPWARRGDSRRPRQRPGTRRVSGRVAGPTVPARGVRQDTSRGIHSFTALFLRMASDVVPDLSPSSPRVSPRAVPGEGGSPVAWLRHIGVPVRRLAMLRSGLPRLGSEACAS